MAKWTSYSYFNLSAKGFDCLSYLALVYRRLVEWKTRVSIQRSLASDDTIQERTILTTKFKVLLAFIPVAEIAPGVFIRGDSLPTASLDRRYKSQGVVDTSVIQYPPISEEYLKIQKGGIYRAAFCSTFPRQSINYYGEMYMPAFNRFYQQTLPTENITGDLDWLGNNAVLYVRDDRYPGTGVRYSPVTWDESSETATLNLEYTAAWCEILDSYYNDYTSSNRSHLMGYDFSGNEINFSTSYSMSLSMQCEKPQVGEGTGWYNGPWSSYTPFYEIGDPIDNPLFTIPFVRS